jgi:competence protein ComEA
MNRTGKPVGRKAKLWIFMIMLALAALFSVILALIFPDCDTVALTEGSTADAAMSGDAGAGKESPGAVEGPGMSQTQEMIPIYLVGAIRQPGIYLVVRDSYLYELVERAGGLTEDAARDEINLAFRLEENQRIRLPSLEQLTEGTGATGQAASAQPILDSTSDGRININSAGADELDKLPGIGPATARAITLYRDEHGRFQSLEELMKVPGIKASRFNALKDLICISSCLVSS